MRGSNDYICFYANVVRRDEHCAFFVDLSTPYDLSLLL